MADDAVIVGSRGSDLVFTPLELGTSKEAHARRDYVRKNASQGELRSHGFFYKPGQNPREGMIGLPIRNEGASGSQFLSEGSARRSSSSRRGRSNSPSLGLAPRVAGDDGPRRLSPRRVLRGLVRQLPRPIFAKGRMFALMGYDLVEGAVEDQGRAAHLVERSRLNFAPRGDAPVDELDD